MTLQLGGGGAITGCTSLQEPALTLSGLTVSGPFEVEKTIVSSGTAAAPSYTFSGDTDNGLYYAGTNSIGLATAGTNAILIDSSGNVGIGTTSPTSGLHLSGAATSNSRFTLTQTTAGLSGTVQQGSTGFALSANGSQNMLLETNGVERLRIGSSGKVGIGTTSPDHGLLTLSQSASSAFNALVIQQGNTGSTATDGLHIGIDSGVDAYITHKESRALAFGTANTERMRIDSSGNVGIGTTSPTEKLHVDGNIRGGRFTAGSGGAAAPDYTFAADDTMGMFRSPGALCFSNGDIERMRIDSSGRLLVGTSSTRGVSAVGSHKVQIEGVGYAQSSLSIVNNENSFQPPYLTLGKSRGTSIGSNTIVQSGDVLGAIDFAGADGSDLGSYGARIACEVDGTPGSNDMPGRLVFSTTADGAASPTVRMTIKEDGVVAVGAGDAPNNERFFASAAISGAAAFRVGPSSGTYAAVVFYDGVNTDCGSIDINTTANTTAYTTSSDYRLKQDVQPLTNSIDRILQLTPCEWNWVKSPETRGEGFIAHEAQVVVPECATGTKDEVDDEGNPVYQGIDQSKLVPLLTAALQEAIAKIKTLEQRLSDAGIT